VSSRQKYLKVLCELTAGSAVGIALILGGSAPAAASQPLVAQPSDAQGQRVSERLAAIREAVSALSDAESQTADSISRQRLAWGNWGNGGWGWGRPWGNYGWGSPWNNWNNWRNGWNNWRNGWLNW
jgi:rSAM-associated Gly-rich repeat protein